MIQTDFFVRPMAKKKMVTDRYAPSTFRVISEDAETTVQKRLYHQAPVTAVPSQRNIIGQPDSHSADEYRYNRPNPNHVGFLRQDVKLLNEPVCDVYTTETRRQQQSWWPHRTSTEPHEVPAYTFNTTARNDYRYRGQGLKVNTRHGGNPNKIPANGCTPVTFQREPEGNQRFWKEGISYEHQFNCRLDPSYRVRSRRQGHFVWDQFPQQEVDRMLRHYGHTSDIKKENATSAPNPVASLSVSKNIEPVISDSCKSMTMRAETTAASSQDKESSVLTPVAV